MKACMMLSVVVVSLFVAACSPGRGTDGPSCAIHMGGKAPATGRTPLDAWLANTPLFVAHRGGDADWVEATAEAYRKAAGWNSQLALEVPVWRTSDGVWVVSEGPTTRRVFGTNDDIRSSTWATLSRLSSTVGAYRMARLVNDVLIPYGRSRILFIDNKADSNVTAFFNLLDSYAGNSRYVSKGYYASSRTATEAHNRGYKTWGYYYARNMGNFASTQSRFDLLGLNSSAPASDFATMRATGKPVIAHIIANASMASVAWCKGASGFMVSGVEEVVPRAPAMLARRPRWLIALAKPRSDRAHGTPGRGSRLDISTICEKCTDVVMIALRDRRRSELGLQCIGNPDATRTILAETQTARRRWDDLPGRFQSPRRVEPRH
jgi:hypothetical protein